MDRNYGVITIISNTLILGRPGVVTFADIIKILAMFEKQLLKFQEKLKELEIMYQNPIYMCIS